MQVKTFLIIEYSTFNVQGHSSSSNLSLKRSIMIVMFILFKLFDSQFYFWFYHHWNVSSVAAANVNEPFLRVAFSLFEIFSILGSFFQGLDLQLGLVRNIFTEMKNWKKWLKSEIIFININAMLILKSWSSKVSSSGCLLHKVIYTIVSDSKDKWFQFNNFSLALNSKTISHQTS